MFYFARHPRETLGLTGDAPRQAWLALRGDPSLPPSRFGLSSAKIFTPRLALSTWLGKKRLGRSLPITNLYNHTQTPCAEGWSVRVSQVRDFRGRRLSYDSHNGTDFAIPPGTRVTASAPGRVVASRNEYNRGGLKLYVDHGEGLLTTYNHLARALTSVGDLVARGQPIALSGYSGMDALASLLSVAPHVHYNVAFCGVLVDPFSEGDDTSLWLGGENAPVPATTFERDCKETRFAPARVEALLQDLVDESRRALFASTGDVQARGWQLLIEALTYPTRFCTKDAGRLLYDESERRERLSLPFSRDDYDDVVFADDVGLRG